MSQEEFKKELDEREYSYEIEGNKIEITHNGNVWLPITILPPGVEFKNHGNVWLNSLTTLPLDLKFSNRGYVSLDSLIEGLFSNWRGNIEGIGSNMLLNKMIALGLFESR